MRSLGRFIKRNAVAILFVLGMLAFGLTYHRQEELIRENRELTLTVEANAQASIKATCDSRTASRNELANLLLGIVDDFIPTSRPALNATRLELERRINDALRSTPDGCGP